jgi:hypothetical protein
VFRLTLADSSNELARFQPTAVRRGKRLGLERTPVSLTLVKAVALQKPALLRQWLFAKAFASHSPIERKGPRQARPRPARRGSRPHRVTRSHAGRHHLARAA